MNDLAFSNADRSSIAEIKISSALKALTDEHGIGHDGNSFACSEIADKTPYSPAVVGGYLSRYADGIAARLTGLVGKTVTLQRYRRRQNGPVYWCVRTL